jgi:hypothetical protein
MKYIKSILIFSVLVGSFSCENINEADQPLSDEQIAFNLSNSGENDPALLIGEWDCVKFAYTADGNNVSDVVKITSSVLVIQVAATSSECEVYDLATGMYRQLEMWRLHCINSSGWLCSLSGNSIKFTFCGGTKIGVPIPHEEWDIEWAFHNAHSFVIKGNELMIFFTGDEGDKKFTSVAGNKKINLLILKKQ